MERCYNCGVDAGCIWVVKYDWLLERGGTRKDYHLFNFLPLSKGVYKVRVRVPESWVGPLEAESVFTFKEDDKLYIGDACYAFPHTDGGTRDWSLLVSKNATIAKASPDVIALPTGGDGLFQVFVDVERLND